MNLQWVILIYEAMYGGYLLLWEIILNSQSVFSVLIRNFEIEVMFDLFNQDETFFEFRQNDCQYI